VSNKKLLIIRQTQKREEKLSNDKREKRITKEQKEANL
jgi:hypothetical protein